MHQTSIIYTPQQNRRVERKYRHILNVAHALGLQASLPYHFWREYVNTIVYLIHQTPSFVLQGKTPLEFYFQNLPTFPIYMFSVVCVTPHPTCIALINFNLVPDSVFF